MPVFDLDHIFTYHSPNQEQGESYAELRNEAKQFAEVLVRLVPPSADLSDAIRKLREVVMTANAGIALKGRVHKIDH